MSHYYPRWPVYLWWFVAAACVAVIFWCCTAFALTPKERTLVQQALTDLDAAIAHGVALEAELFQANLHSGLAGKAAHEAAESVAVAATKIKTAEEQVDREHEELVRCAGENAKMRVLVAKVTGPWWFPGGNALLYGIGKSLISLFVIIAVLIVVGILLKVFAPWAAPAFAFIGRIGRRIMLLFKRKPKG